MLDASLISGINTASISSGIVNISNTGIAKNIELYIDNLVHDNPSDLSMILTPPSGDSILLSYRNKINNYSKNNGIKFAFSNKALPGTYLNNKSNSSDLYVNILPNTGVCLPSPYNVNYKYSFDHLFDAGAGAISGDWGLYFIDHDVGGSGYIGGWNIVVTYEPPPYNENE
jgi:subtilisin-like proprotein convertase family protein